MFCRYYTIDAAYAFFIFDLIHLLDHHFLILNISTRRADRLRCSTMLSELVPRWSMIISLIATSWVRRGVHKSGRVWLLPLHYIRLGSISRLRDSDLVWLLPCGSCLWTIRDTF